MAWHFPTDSRERKEYPVVTGFMDYFPAAIFEIAHLSWVANNKHNPGMPLHWSREKSADHLDCEGRHLIERGGFDEISWTDEHGVRQTRRVRHSVARAWRALADLQLELEAEGAPRAKASIPPKPLIDYSHEISPKS